MDVANIKKFLKVFSIICIVAYGLFAALGVAIMMGLVPLETITEGMGVSGLLEGADAKLYASITGGVFAAAYLVQALFTIPVLRGIKNPSKMGLGVVLYAILTVAIGANLVMTAMRGGDITMLMPQFVATVCIFVGCVEVRRAGK